MGLRRSCERHREQRVAVPPERDTCTPAVETATRDRHGAVVCAVGYAWLAEHAPLQRAWLPKDGSQGTFSALSGAVAADEKVVAAKGMAAPGAGGECTGAVVPLVPLVPRHQRGDEIKSPTFRCSPGRRIVSPGFRLGFQLTFALCMRVTSHWCR